MKVRVAALPVLVCLAEMAYSSPHVVQIEGLLPDAEEGLLLGNGDLSCSVWPKGDELVFRLGKGDVWDRRLSYNEGVKPATLAEYRNGILREGWKRAQWGLQTLPVATKGTKDEKRLRELIARARPEWQRQANTLADSVPVYRAIKAILAKGGISREAADILFPRQSKNNPDSLRGALARHGLVKADGEAGIDDLASIAADESFATLKDMARAIAKAEPRRQYINQIIKGLLQNPKSMFAIKRKST